MMSRYLGSRRYDWQRPVPSRNHQEEVKHAWQDTPSPRGNAEDAKSSFDRSQQRPDTYPAATGDMETDETHDKSNEDMSLKTTTELFTTLKSLPELVEQSRREIAIIYQAAPTKVTRENAELKKNLEQLTKENQNLKSTSNTNQGDQVNKLKNDLENATEVADKYKYAYLEIKGKFKETLDSTEALRDAAQKDSEKNEELEESLRQLKHDMDALARENESLKRDLSRSKDIYTKAEDDKKKAESELSQSRTRLSRLMGNKLSDNNPDIADLSDKNRPTKIAERYTELYDNEWTDAFEVFHKHYNDDKRTAEALLQILWDVKDQCDKITKEQDQKLREAVVLKRTRDKSLPEHTMKQIKDFRRFIVEASLPEVIEKCLQNTSHKRFTSWSKDEHVETFYKCCTELCWLMSVQDPPLAFREMPKTMERFDTDTYKPYTATGTKVDYVVWPALLLKESGPLLSKGVAQACGQQPTKSFKQRYTESPSRSDTKIPTPTWAPSGQVMDRQTFESGSNGNRQNHHFYNSSSKVYGTGQSVHQHNYEQSVIGGGNHAEKYKNLSRTTHEQRSASSANKNENLGHSQRELSERTVVMPRKDVWLKFLHLGNLYGIDSEIVKLELGENYTVCQDYYGHLFPNQGESTV